MTDTCESTTKGTGSMSSIIADRARGALYGLLIADALAMPTHWFYGGSSQVKQMYGGLIQGYVPPVTKLPGSIMSKSDTGGGGRGGTQGDIIGNVIFHGKKKFWASGADYHYHQGMSAGDNTLEPVLMRRALSVVASNGGKFDVSTLTKDYINFMTTPHTHNDTYCGTCHRMYFAKWAAGKAPAECPDNDGHNVDTTDALVTTVPIALLSATDTQAADDVAAMVAITRASTRAIDVAKLLSTTLRETVRGGDLRQLVKNLGKNVGYDVERAVAMSQHNDPLHACYIDQSFPAVLFMVYKYGGASPDTAAFKQAVLANANRGGENVATGAIIGALIGASIGFKALPADLVAGLAPSAKEDIEKEITAFIENAPFCAGR
eukprot:m.172479 g.172479  ORF g.172479 m.172479 type:complete len:377 (-) comp31687_c0_seq1:260-1390(-)